MELNDIGTFLAYYGGLRARTLRVARLVPDDRLEWCPAPGRSSPGDLLRHLAGTERFLWAETVQGRPACYPGCGPELATGLPATLSYLDALHRESLAIFAALTPSDLRRPVQTPAGATITAWKWLQALTEHEVHHRGQLYVYLGLLGVPAPPIFGLTEAEVRARSVDRLPG